MTGRYAGHDPIRALRLAVLDGHQGILDGYHYRFDAVPSIRIVVEALTGAEFETLLADNPADVALMELRAPAAPDNPGAYPLLHAIPRLLDRFPNLAVLVFSTDADPRHIRAVMEAGAGGYIVKDDAPIYPVLPQVLVSVCQGGIFYSPSAQAALRQLEPQTGQPPLLTQRQLQALSLCAAYPRYTISDIATQLGVRPSTARNLLSQAYERLQVTSRHEAVLRAEKLGLLPGNRPGP